MKKLIYVVALLMMVGCASERDRRTINQIITPDKMNMQMHVNPDIQNDTRDDTEIHQVRIGFDWNL